ncbi:MAG: SUKH-4 family immunity protein [Caulobacteraceae bacterium]
MTDEEMKKFWGEERLLRWHPTDVREAAIPQSTKDFLVSVGLPKDLLFDEYFDPCHPLCPNPVRQGSWTLGSRFDKSDYVIEPDGRLLWVSTGKEARSGLINSSVAQMAICLTLHRQLLDESGRENDVLRIEALRHCRATILSTDTHAFDDDEGLWFVRFAEIERHQPEQLFVLCFFASLERQQEEMASLEAASANEEYASWSRDSLAQVMLEELETLRHLLEAKIINGFPPTFTPVQRGALEAIIEEVEAALFQDGDAPNARPPDWERLRASPVWAAVRQRSEETLALFDAKLSDFWTPHCWG